MSSIPPVPSALGGEGEPSAPAVVQADDDAEDPRRRAARLRRRRRLLAWGAAPALVMTIVSVWMGFVFLMTLAANRAAVAGNYPAAVSRYETVARVNPWLDAWRVHYNLGTARLLADDADGAVTELEEALTTAPAADMVEAQSQDGTETWQIRDPEAPECLVRVNLYTAHLARAQRATEEGDEAGAQTAMDEATAAAGECEVPPPPDPSSDPSDSPSADPSDSPSSDPSSDPSDSPSSDPSSDPSDSPSSDPSSDPSSSASASPSGSPTGGASGTPSASPSASPSSDDPQRDKLKGRNGRANGDGGKGGGNGRKW